MEQLEMPSKVTDRKYIRMPQKDKVVESDEEWEKCGKWVLIIPDADLDFSDKAWTDLQQLLTDGTLIMLKASTALMLETSVTRKRSEGSVIICFTRPGKQEAKRAAKAIRKIVDSRYIMNYKVNKDTNAGIDTRHGHKHISIYMYTYLGRFYVKDIFDRWILDSEDNEKKISIARQFYARNYLGFKGLPSKSQNRFLNLGRTDSEEGITNWFLWCSYLEEDDRYLAEVDRVWIISKKLLDEGVFSGISYRKQITAVEIRLCVSEYFDVCSMLKHLDRIFDEATVKSPMYFTNGNEAKIYLQETPHESAKYYTKIERGKKVYYKQTSDEIVYFPKGKENKVLHSYKYTSEGERYETSKYGELFVSQRGLQ